MPIYLKDHAPDIFHGRCLGLQFLLEEAEGEEAGNEVEEDIEGLTGIWTLDLGLTTISTFGSKISKKAHPMV